MLHPTPPAVRTRAHGALRPALRMLLAGALGLAAALALSCGSSSRALIPVAHAGPLLSDFEAVRQSAETGNGNCLATKAALLKTDEDFAALPLAVDAGLRNTLHQGIANLRLQALALCAQPLGGATATTTTPKTTTSTTTTTPTTTTTTSTTPTTPTTPTTETPGQGGGTVAPGEGGGEGGGTGAGEPEQGAGGGVGAGGLEAGK